VIEVRVRTEIQRLKQFVANSNNTIQLLGVHPSLQQVMLQFNVRALTSATTLAEHHELSIDLSDFPHHAPTMRFTSAPPFLPNVYPTGVVCLAKSAFKPNTTLVSLMCQLLAMLQAVTFNLDSPANANAFEQYRDDRFVQAVRQWIGPPVLLDPNVDGQGLELTGSSGGIKTVSGKPDLPSIKTIKRHSDQMNTEEAS
jgi:ubiquitin-protein ligase